LSQYDRPGLDDPLWDYVLSTRLRPYIDAVRKWWSEVEELTVSDTGVYAIDYGPPGLVFRFTRSPTKSPVKNVQAFPMVTTAYLQITGIQGGSNKMVERVCINNRFTMDEFTIIEKHNLPSTFQQGQFVAFVPTDILNNTEVFGRWIYITRDELIHLVKGHVTGTMQVKAMNKL
jgi:hypothetical protein